MPRSRRHAAYASTAADISARNGCTGAQYDSAPLTPAASTTSLLHTGHPTAKNDSTPPPAACAAPPWPAAPARTYVASRTPSSAAVTARAG